METFTWIVILLVGASVLVGFARRIRAPYPAFLALAGVGVALVPGSPDIRIDPEVALALFIAPVLVDAAFDSSLRDLRRNWLPVGSLALVAVGLTTAGVAWTAKQLFPDMPWAAAVALGAAVAPPDAASTTAVLSQLKAPQRLKAILEGESLLNDAGSLIVFRLAVAAAAGATVEGWSLAPRFLLVAAGSVLAGYLFGRAYWRISQWIQHPPTAILMQFMSSFLLWIVADALGLSAVLTVVVMALTISQQPDRTGARLRIPSFAVWETAVFVLNAFAFMLIGLQVDGILAGLAPAERNRLLWAGAVVLAATIAIRVVWVMGYNSVVRLSHAVFGFKPRRPAQRPTFATGLIVSWAGMRGILSLAAALSLPEDFPFRDEVVFLAFTVVLGTLVVQGLTLGPLIRLLGVKDDGTLDEEVRAARAAMARAALDAVGDDDDPAAAAVRHELEAVLAAAAESSRHVRPSTPHFEVRRRAVKAARDALEALRRDGDIGDDAYQLVQQELDWSELSNPEETPV